MAFFGKNKKAENTETSDVKAKNNAPDPVSDKQRQKKIKKMKSKFDETVWSNALDIMKTEIPKFVITEPDPDLEDAQIVKYVLLGFDTKIVDDFSNKADDDIGSIMTAIKSSMDCVIEYGLFDNELILMIPTTKTLNALKEFEDTFDLKFHVTYMTEDHAVTLETKSADSEEPIFFTMDDIRSMLENDIYIKDQIQMIQNNTSYNDGVDDITKPEEEGEDETKFVASTNESNDDDAIPEEELEEDFGNADREEVIPDEDYPEEDAIDSEEVKKTVADAVDSAKNAASKVSEKKEELDEATKQAASKTEAPQTSEVKPATAASDKLAKLRAAVQKASDDALEDKDVKNASVNINPQNRMQTFDQAAMDSYITRKYYSDDLGLEISSEPFDAMFMQSNEFAAFVEVEGDDWLSGYVNNLRRDANTRLYKLHKENLQIMRERFMLIITKHCEEIVKSVSTDDPKSRFGYVLKTITQIKNENLAKVSETSEAYKREKEAAYQNRMQTEMTNAANMAKANFINRYEKEHQSELREIETDLRNNIESEYITAVENLKTERRNEAKRQLDAGISEALKLCADEYTKMLAMERKEYVRLQKVITDFQNENMAADEARIFTLSEEQRRSNEVVKVREEYDAKYDLANKEFEAKLAAIQAEIEKTNVEHENYVDELKEQHERIMQDLRNAHKDQIQHKENEISMLNDQLTSANNQIETLTRKYSELDEKTGRKYAQQIDMLKSEREAWTERAEQVENLHKYTDKLKLTGMIVGVVAALGIGVIIGCAVSAQSAKNNAVSTTETPIIHYITDEDVENTESDVDVNVTTKESDTQKSTNSDASTKDEN